MVAPGTFIGLAPEENGVISVEIEDPFDVALERFRGTRIKMALWSGARHGLSPNRDWQALLLGGRRFEVTPAGDDLLHFVMETEPVGIDRSRLRQESR